MSSQSRSEPAAARSSIQHALSAADGCEPGCGGWKKLYGPGVVRRRTGEEIWRARRDGHYQLQHVPSLRITRNPMSRKSGETWGTPILEVSIERAAKRRDVK